MQGFFHQPDITGLMAAICFVLSDSSAEIHISEQREVFLENLSKTL